MVNYVLSLTLLMSSIGVICMTFYLLKRRDARIALLFILFFCIAVYSAGYAFELASPTLEQMIFWNGVQFIGLPFIPAFWLFYLIRSSTSPLYLHPLYIFFIFLIPFITVAVRLSNRFHSLYYCSYSVADVGLHTLKLVGGPFCIVLNLYVLFCIAASWAILRRNMKDKKTYQYRRSIFMLVIMAIPSAAFALNTFNLRPSGMDLVPFALFLSMLLFLLDVRKFNFFDGGEKLICELQTDESILQMVLESIGNVIVIFDNTRQITNVVNDTYAQMFGQTLDTDSKLAADQILNRVHPADLDRVAGDLNSILCLGSGGGRKFDCRMLNRDNNYIWVRATIRPIVNADKKKNLSIFSLSSINEERKKLEALTKKAEFDSTGVYNRATAFEKIKQALKSTNKVPGCHAILLFDIDNLKKINDNCGHSIGDRVIQGFAQILRSDLLSGSILGRVGGDEFIAFIRNAPSMEDIERALTGVLKKCRQLQMTYRISMPVSISVGVAPVSGNSASFEELYENADVALYEVKNNLKNGFCYYDRSLCKKTKPTIYEHELFHAVRDAAFSYDTGDTGKMLLSVGATGVLVLQKTNRPAEKMLRLAGHIHQGVAWNRFDFDRKELYTKKINECIAKTEVVRFRDRFKADGKLNVIHAVMHPVTKGKSVLYIVVTLNDITKEFSMISDRNMLIEEYRSMFNMGGDCLAVIRRDEGEYYIKHANQNFINFLKALNGKYCGESISGRRVNELYPSDFFDQESTCFARVLDGRSFVRRRLQCAPVRKTLSIAYYPVGSRDGIQSDSEPLPCDTLILKIELMPSYTHPE